MRGLPVTPRVYLGPKPGSSREDVFDLRENFLIDGEVPKTRGFPSLEISVTGQQTHQVPQGGVTASITVETSNSVLQTSAP